MRLQQSSLPSCQASFACRYDSSSVRFGSTVRKVYSRAITERTKYGYQYIERLQVVDGVLYGLPTSKSLAKVRYRLDLCAAGVIEEAILATLLRDQLETGGAHARDTCLNAESATHSARVRTQSDPSYHTHEVCQIHATSCQIHASTSQA